VHRYFIIHKPYGMESQFLSSVPTPLLGDLTFNFPKGTHAIGRLDKNSEGLLLLTTNKKITALLFESPIPHLRTYLVQVRGQVTAGEIKTLRKGVLIRISADQWYQTKACEVEMVSAPAVPSPRPFPAYLESSWLKITITEGKFRQVRKMIYAIHRRCMRLVRISIEDLQLEDLEPGNVKEIPEKVFFEKLRLDMSSLGSPD
jgi:23S rRNA pseudouridine2457 synthase